MKNKKTLKSVNLIKENQDKLLKIWEDDVQKNTQFKGFSFNQKNELFSNSKALLTQIIDPKITAEVDKIHTQSLKPVLKLWHQMLKEQLQKGVSTKETTLLILSLKSSVQKLFEDHFKEQEYDYSKELSSVNQLLDILGILTFEIYSMENESVISKKDKQIEYLQSTRKPFLGDLIGESPQMQHVFKTMGHIMENTVTVLLEGESGTGKDRIANVIHENSARKNKPFIVVNCAAIPKELIESELFGHEKGAFTGADTKRIGKFELADGGTLFLDEIGELPLAMQSTLLRAIQTKQIERVGGTNSIPVDIRIIAATNRSLEEEVKEKRFRLDLLYRINTFPIIIPPLRERKEDIIPLTLYFIEKYAAQFKSKVTNIHPLAEAYLLEQLWEGNIRELENKVQRALIVCVGDILTKESLEFTTAFVPEKIPKALPPGTLSLANAEKSAVLAALKATKWNIKQAAIRLNVSRTTLYNKLAAYKIKKETHED